MAAGQILDNSFTGWQNLPLGESCVSQRRDGGVSDISFGSSFSLSRVCVCEDGNKFWFVEESGVGCF